VLDALQAEFTTAPVAHLRTFLTGGSRGFSQERRAPPAPTLRLRMPEEDPAVAEFRARAG
jgi:hypothetical protein